MGDVLPAAAFVIEKNSLKWFVIKADGNAEYQHIDRVMEQLRQANVRNIAMLTGQESVG
jgi:biopolymer transport protein ExbD